MKTSTKILIALCVVGLLIGIWLTRGLMHTDPEPGKWEPVNEQPVKEAKQKADTAFRKYEKSYNDYIDSVISDSERADYERRLRPKIEAKPAGLGDHVRKIKAGSGQLAGGL